MASISNSAPMRIDFHSNVSNQLDYACRLVRKALAAQYEFIVLLHQDEKQLADCDQLLWKFSDTDFLPHAVHKKADPALVQHTPILLALASELSTLNLLTETGEQRDAILINLSHAIPEHFTKFQRLVEIIPQESADSQASQATQAGRERYRFYQRQGHQLNHIIAK